MILEIPPGVKFLAPKLPILFAPPVLLHFLFKVTGIQVSLWLFALLIAITFPLVFLISIVSTDLINMRNAHVRGATFPTQVRHGGPGGFAIVDYMLRSYVEDYPGNVAIRLYICYPLMLSMIR
jgi:hypothetical protein